MMKKNTGNMRIRRRWPFYTAIAALLVLAFISLFPLVLVLINSVKTHEEIMRNPFTFSLKPHFDNFTKTWEVGKFSLGFINSIKVTGTAIIVGVLSSASMGYVLATRRIRIWRLLTLYFMMATTVPLQMFMLPLYSTFSRLNLIGNTFAVGVAIAAWNLPMPIFLMRTYFLKVPYELEEAARLDGASTLQVFWRVVMPIASPGMVTVACIVGLFAWNEYLLSSMLLQSEVFYTATLKYLSLNGTFSRDFSVIMSGAVIMLVPIIVIFLLLQEQFVEGMAAGSVKG